MNELKKEELKLCVSSSLMVFKMINAIDGCKIVKWLDVSDVVGGFQRRETGELQLESFGPLHLHQRRSRFRSDGIAQVLAIAFVRSAHQFSRNALLGTCPTVTRYLLHIDF